MIDDESDWVLPMQTTYIILPFMPNWHWFLPMIWSYTCSTILFSQDHQLTSNQVTESQYHLSSPLAATPSTMHFGTYLFPRPAASWWSNYTPMTSICPSLLDRWRRRKVILTDSLSRPIRFKPLSSGPWLTRLQYCLGSHHWICCALKIATALPHHGKHNPSLLPCTHPTCASQDVIKQLTTVDIALLWWERLQTGPRLWFSLPSAHFLIMQRPAPESIIADEYS